MKHPIYITLPITEDIISDFHISAPDISNLIDYDLWTSMHKIFDGTEEEYKKYMQTDADTLYITKDAYDTLFKENKIYYMFDYSVYKLLENYTNFAKQLSVHVYPIVFLKKPYDEECPYHIYRLINPQNKDPHLIDITSRIKHNFKYWISTYSPISDNSYEVNVQQEVETNPAYFYDTKDEAIIGMIEYVYDKCVAKIGPVTSEYMMLNCKFTYDKVFNKIYNKKIESLKEDINKELSDKKDKAKQQMDHYQNMMKSLLEYKREING